MDECYAGAVPQRFGITYGFCYKICKFNPTALEPHAINYGLKAGIFGQNNFRLTG